MLAGSTRLKAGTATKLVLNMLTTISMIRLGKVVSNLMVDVEPTNEKLRNRACRIVAALRHCSEAEARRRLRWANWRVKLALR
jgi:N-acetylmuramic acid 6-phosphate etherase